MKLYLATLLLALLSACVGGDPEPEPEPRCHDKGIVSRPVQCEVER